MLRDSEKLVPVCAKSHMPIFFSNTNMAWMHKRAECMLLHSQIGPIGPSLTLCIIKWARRAWANSWRAPLYAVSRNSCIRQRRCWVKLHTTTSCAIAHEWRARNVITRRNFCARIYAWHSSARHATMYSIYWLDTHFCLWGLRGSVWHALLNRQQIQATLWPK